jgi:TolA-binding protein
LNDADGDKSEKRDKAMLIVSNEQGEEETVSLEETLSHSGIFTGSFALKANEKPTKGNHQAQADPAIEGFFGSKLNVAYLDDHPASQEGQLIVKAEVAVADGSDGKLASFSKVFDQEELAVQTQFTIAESHFELFKSHLALNRQAPAAIELAAGRKVLQELAEDFPGSKYGARISYLSGQFAQEMKDWPAAIAAYQSIIRDAPEHTLAADAQFKLGQCYEAAQRPDDAMEAYVTLAASYPKSPLIANAMVRMNDYFYEKEDYKVAAQVGIKFIERFPSHQWAPKLAFRVGQCHYKDKQFKAGGQAFDNLVKQFPEDELTPQALFWAGECYRGANDVPNAFRRYNRCRWDFPETEAAKFARGRLALPEMLAQFERESNVDEDGK